VELEEVGDNKTTGTANMKAEKESEKQDTNSSSVTDSTGSEESLKNQPLRV